MGRVWISWNVRGLGQARKRYAVKKACSKLKPELILIQETKINGDRESELQSWAESLNMELEAVHAEGVAY